MFTECPLWHNHVADANHTDAFCQPKPRLRCARGISVSLYNQVCFPTVDELLNLAFDFVPFLALFIAFFIPVSIAVSIGAASQSRMGMGIVIVGGTIFSLILTLYVIPAVYLMWSREKKHLAELDNLDQYEQESV